MKKLLVIPTFLFAATALFYACEKEQNLSDDALIEQIAAADLQVIELTQLPSQARQTVDELFFDTYMEDLFRARGLGYLVVLGNETRLYFRENGDMLEFRDPNPRNLGHHGPHGPCFDRILGFGNQIRPAALPQAVLDYVTENYPDANIRMVRAQGNRILVLLTGPVVLMFDRTGNFVQEVSPLENCNPARCNMVPGSALPAGIRQYVADNYPDAAFRAACVRNDRIAVFMVNDGARLILIFDRATGEFLFSRP